MILSLGIILVGAEGFTNAIEWLGKKLKLGAGAVGSIFAAVGTALPETMVPIVAFVSGGEAAAEEVGVGAILGAPFMLATLATFIAGFSVYIFRKNNSPLLVDTEVVRRDLSFFLWAYATAILASLLPNHQMKNLVAIGLVLFYFYYVYRTIRASHGSHEHGDLAPLYIARKNHNPSMLLVTLQIVLALLAIVVGARTFVDSVESVAAATGISVLVLSLIITPIATELPEKFNSVLWLRRGKDTLAIGNITGAMVFQSSVIPAIGIALTDWTLEPISLWNATLAIGSASLTYFLLRRRGGILPSSLMMGGIFYAIFLISLFLVPAFH